MIYAVIAFLVLAVVLGTLRFRKVWRDRRRDAFRQNFSNSDSAPIQFRLVDEAPRNEAAPKIVRPSLDTSRHYVFGEGSLEPESNGLTSPDWALRRSSRHRRRRRRR